MLGESETEGGTGDHPAWSPAALLRRKAFDDRAWTAQDLAAMERMLARLARRLAARRSRIVSALSGAALLGGSLATRFGVYEAGVTSAKDPKYTVVPQRERLDASRPGGAEPQHHDAHERRQNGGHGHVHE